MRFRVLCVLCLLVTAVGLTTRSEASEADVLTLATRIVQTSGASGGFCSLIGSPDAELAVALAKQGPFTIHCLCETAEQRTAMLEAIQTRGLAGRVSAVVWRGSELPYADNLINIVVIERPDQFGTGPLPVADVRRVLAPLGTLIVGNRREATRPKWLDPVKAKLSAVGPDVSAMDRSMGAWLVVKKPWPSDIDQWTHFLHGADGNPVALDQRVGPPKYYQWVGGPLWQRSHETDSTISTVVSSQGRVFYIVDEAPISVAGQHSLPDKWALVGRDAFNGVVLWRVPIRRWGWREWKPTWFTNRPGDFPLNRQKRLVAAGDHVYVTLGYHAPVSQLDAKTGVIVQTYADTENTNEILLVGSTLYLSVLTDDRVKVMAVDAATGRTKWTTKGTYRGSTVDYLKWSSRYASMNKPKLDPSINTATDGDTLALIDAKDIVAIDCKTGEERWRQKFPSAEADRAAGGIQNDGTLWIGTMIVTDGVVLHASPSKLAALSADTGKVLWEQPKKYIGHLWYEWKDVFVINGLVWTWSADLDETFIQSGGRKQHEFWPKTVNGYDLHTGEMKKEVPLGNIFKTHHHHRCYRNKATPRFILASRRGTEFVDLNDGHHLIHNWVRGTCHVGMMPANGLQYAPPHPCQCYIEEKLSGFNALAAETAAENKTIASTDRLQRGDAFNQRIDESKAAADPTLDWPAFRHDALRTGAIATSVPADTTSAWSSVIGTKLSAPVAVGDRVYVALVDEHTVACLDRHDGHAVWRFAADGRVNSPPTYDRGRVLFGSADGSVYCLRALDGVLIWRFQAATTHRLMAAFGQFESAWPIFGSVLVQDDTVYFSAGRSSELDGGMTLYGLNVATGDVLHRNQLQGPSYAVGEFEQNFQLPTGSLSDILTSDGSRIFMRSLAFDTDLQQVKGKPELQVPGGLLEGSYFKRIPWTFAGEYGRLIVHDDRSVYYVRQFDSLRGLDPTVFFTPGGKGYLLFAKNAKAKTKAWMERIPIRIRAMVLADRHLFVAGPPDVVDPKDPLGAFEGRKGGLLYVFDTATGEKLAEHTLPSPPVFNGLAAARGRLYLCDEAGAITCFSAN